MKQANEKNQENQSPQKFSEDSWEGGWDSPAGKAYLKRQEERFKKNFKAFAEERDKALEADRPDLVPVPGN